LVAVAPDDRRSGQGAATKLGQMKWLLWLLMKRARLATRSFCLAARSGCGR
jgi:hypothetical protein